jgi:xanthine dehydrogenase YagS FAD-binding subunit
MRPFEYAAPRTEAEAVALLNAHDGHTAVLAGGTDLFNLLKRDLVSPRRVVDIKNIESMRGTTPVSDGVLVGALTTLGDILSEPLLADYASVRQVADAVHAIQIRDNGTLGGDLCLLPNCWYFRNGYGLLGQDHGQSLVNDGRNELHAIFGNRGPAKFVSASRFAPALIAWGARVRIVGPAPDQVSLLPLEYFFVTPKSADQGVTVLQPGQFISHVWLPTAAHNVASATYEVLQLQGLDWPLAAASACVETSAGIVKDARIVLGHVAPTPWSSFDAVAAIVGREITESTAQAAGDAAVAKATPLSENEYKVQLARTAVKRALLRAAGQLEGVS